MQLLLFLQLLFLISFATASSLKRNEGDPEFEAYLRQVLENFREQMKNGIPGIKVPPLDPLSLYDIRIHIQEKEADVKLNFHEITITNLSKFKIEVLKSNLENLYVNINFSLPHIKATGTYKLDGLIIKIFPLYGEGKYEVEATDASIGGIGKMTLDKEGIQFSTLSLDFSWGTLKVNFENLLKGGSFSKFIQKVIPSLGKGLFDHFKPEILKLIDKALINEVNKELKKPEVKKIIESIIPKK